MTTYQKAGSNSKTIEDEVFLKKVAQLWRRSTMTSEHHSIVENTDKKIIDCTDINSVSAESCSTQ